MVADLEDTTVVLKDKKSAEHSGGYLVVLTANLQAAKMEIHSACLTAGM